MLYFEYQRMTDENDKELVDKVKMSLEARWKKADQDVFIACIILVPWIQLKPFNTLHESGIFNFSSIFQLFARLWERFYNEKPPEILYNNVREYIEKKGRFASIDAIIPGLRADAELEVNHNVF
jgi:hypothetical protein